MLCCLVLLCVHHVTVGWGLNTNVNNRILKVRTLFSYIVQYNKHPDDG
jgi:hypothetical protein